MNFEEFKKEFLNNIKDIKVTEEQIKMFYDYMIQILEWNQKINLTSITNEKEFIIKHFIDSLTVNKYLEGKQSIIDIGTGAGFPGMPLKIVNKEKKIVLVDSINKKLNVIRNINERIKLDNLEIIHSRAEDLGINSQYREKFDVATTRAVSNLSTILEYMLPFVKVGGLAICMKGPNYEDELKLATKAISVLGGKLEKIENINIDRELQRNLVIIKKIKNTPNKYPRGKAKPLKEPII